MVVVDACEQLNDAVSALAGETRDGWSGPALNDRVLGVTEGVQRTEAELVRTLVQWDDVKAWNIDSTLTPARWLAHHTGLSKAASRRLMRCVRVCRRHRTVLDALTAGDITVEHVERLANLSFGAREKLFQRDLDMLLRAANRLSVDDFITAARVWRALSDDVLADDEFMDRFDNRALYISELADGRVRMDAEWDEDGGSIVMAAIMSKAHKHDSPNRPGGPRTIAQRRADALTDICRDWLANQNTRAGGPVHTVELVIDLETLTESIPEDMLDELLDDLEDPEGDDPTWDDVLPDRHDAGAHQRSDDPTETDRRRERGTDHPARSSAHDPDESSTAVAPPADRSAATGARQPAAADPNLDVEPGAGAEADTDAAPDAGAEPNMDAEPAAQAGASSGVASPADAEPNVASDADPDADPAFHRSSIDREPDTASDSGDPPNTAVEPTDRPWAEPSSGRAPPDRSRRPRPPLTLESLLRRRCEIRGVGPIGRNTMLRLLCDSYIGRVVVRGPNQVINVGRRSRTFNTAQRRGIAIRDGDTCSEEGCDEPGYACDWHHEDPFGPPLTGTGHTDIANGHFKCRYDHVHTHEGRHRNER